MNSNLGLVWCHCEHLRKLYRNATRPSCHCERAQRPKNPECNDRRSDRPVAPTTNNHVPNIRLPSPVIRPTSPPPSRRFFVIAQNNTGNSRHGNCVTPVREILRSGRVSLAGKRVVSLTNAPKPDAGGRVLRWPAFPRARVRSPARRPPAPGAPSCWPRRWGR